MSTVEDEPTREQKTREAMIELTSKLVTDETARNESHGPETVAESQEPETVYSPENKVDQLRSKLANNSFTFGNIEVKNNQIKIGDTELAEDAMIEPNAFRPVSGEEMDHKMAMSQTYRFLSKCASAQEWVNSFVPCPDIATFFSELPRGFHLAKIASLCGFNKTVHGLEKAAYYEVINISTFLEFCRKIRVKECYLFETNDLRESKNMQKVVYCLHAVARKLQRIGHGQGIQHLKKSFTKEEIDLVDDENVGVFEEHLYDQLENDSNSSEEIEGEVVEELVEEKEEQLVEEEEQLLVEKEEVVEKDQLLVEEQLLEEVDNNINNNLAVDLQNSHPTPEQVHALDSFVKTLSFTDAFKNILYNEKIKLISLKKFIFLMPQDKPEYIGTDIIDQFRRNYAMKEQIDETYRSVRLLLENQAEMRGLRRSRPRPKSDFGPFKQVLYNFMVDHAMVSDLILQNEAIPLEHVYNDTIVGDYHFSKVLLRIKENETAQQIATRHFLNSKTAAEISRLYHSQPLPSLSPVQIYQEIYDLNIYDQDALLDVALAEDRVLNELETRITTVVAHLIGFLKLLETVELPIYCNLFPDKYALFIKPAILSTKMGELEDDALRRIFRGSHQSETESTSLINRAEFSQLRQFADQTQSPKSASLLYSDRNEINERLLQKLEYSSGMRVTLGHEAVNGLILLWKKNRDGFRGGTRRIIEQMEMFGIRGPVELDLDCFYCERESSYSNGLQSIINEAKRKFVILFKHSSKRDVLGMLHVRGEGRQLDDGCYSSDFDCYDGTVLSSLKAIKKSLVSDLEFLESQGVTSRSCEYAEMLEMIARAILKPENRDLELNDETAEMVYQRGELMSGTASRLEGYYASFVSKCSRRSNRVVSLKNAVVAESGRLGTENATVSIREVEPLLFRATVQIGAATLVTGSFRLTDLLGEIEDGSRTLSLENTVKLDALALLAAINANYVSL